MWAMFSPTPSDVRRFFCTVYHKQQQQQPMEAIETLAAGWIAEHPEFHATLADLEQALRDLQSPQSPSAQPFLHLSLHLSLSEQCSIDQPPGIRQAVELLAARRGSLHAAHHEAMDCLSQMLWDSQRSGRPPDGHAYLDQVRRRATRD